MTSHYLDQLLNRISALNACRDDIQLAFEMLRSAYQDGRKILICGNGGSAADSEHWAGELLKGFRIRRSLSMAQRNKLPSYLASSLQGALPTIPLTGFHAFTSAFSNDVSPELVFAQLVWGLGQAGDVLIGISTSGNARNVCAAMETGRAMGLFTLGLTGKSGGALKSLCDVTIAVPATETFLIQEYHLPVYHCLSFMLEDEFFSE